MVGSQPLCSERTIRQVSQEVMVEGNVLRRAQLLPGMSDMCGSRR